MLIVLLSLLFAPAGRDLTEPASLVNATRVVASVCQLEMPAIKGGAYVAGSPLIELDEILARHGARVDSGCRRRGEPLCELSARLRVGAAEVVVEAGAFWRDGEPLARLHTVNIRGPEPLIERARALAGC